MDEVCVSVCVLWGAGGWAVYAHHDLAGATIEGGMETEELEKRGRGKGVMRDGTAHLSDPLLENEADRSECALKMFPF